MKLIDKAQEKVKAQRFEKLKTGRVSAVHLPKHWRTKDLALFSHRRNILISVLVIVAVMSSGAVYNALFPSSAGFLITAGICLPVLICGIVISGLSFYAGQEAKHGSKTLWGDPVPQEERTAPAVTEGELASWERRQLRQVISPMELEACSTLPGEMVRELYGGMMWEATPENFDWVNRMLKLSVANNFNWFATEDETRQEIVDLMSCFNAMENWLVESDAPFKVETDYAFKSARKAVTYMTKSVKGQVMLGSNCELQAVNAVVVLNLVGDGVLIYSCGAQTTAAACDEFRRMFQNFVLAKLAEVERRFDKMEMVEPVAQLVGS